MTVSRNRVDRCYFGQIGTRDGSSVWDELRQRRVVTLIFRLCINTGNKSDHPSRRIMRVVRLDRRTIVDNSSERMIDLFFRMYRQTYYRTNYPSLFNFVPGEWSVSSVFTRQMICLDGWSFLTHYPSLVWIHPLLGTDRTDIGVAPPRDK